MAKIIRKKFQIKIKPLNKECEFCTKKIQPDYKQYDILKNYLTERAKIFGKDYSALCSKHQRKLSIEIKRARFLSLLPFTVQVK